MNTFRVSSKSKCSATDPASEFSMGMTAACTEPFSTRSNTSADRAHGYTAARGCIFPAASWLNEPSSPWMATFMFCAEHNRPRSSSLLPAAPRSCPQFCLQTFRHEVCVERLARVVLRQGAKHLITELMIELQSSFVIDRSLQTHVSATGGPQSLLTFLHQPRGQSRAARLGHNVEGQNASDFPANRVGNHEACDSCLVCGSIGVIRTLAAFISVRCFGFCNQCDRVSLHDEARQLHLGIGYTGRKAELVDLPEAIEIGRAIVADGELHASSLGLHWQPAQATGWAAAFSIFSMATIATHSLLRFR